VEEVGVFLIAGVVGYGALRWSFFLKTKLRGTFDEVLPYVLILGFAILCGAYWVAPWLGALMNLATIKTGISFQCPKDGLLENISWRDVDAVWMAAPVSLLVALVIDGVVLLRIGVKSKTWGRELLSLAAGFVLIDQIEEDGDDFEQFRMGATYEDRQILVTLTNNRLYYGQPTFEPRHPKKLVDHGSYRQLRMEPLLSGYRDKEKLQVYFTDMHPVGREKPSLLEIPYDKILSLQTVDPDFLMDNAKMEPQVSALFFSEETSKKPPSSQK
jgi:hypothetical protein